METVTVSPKFQVVIPAAVRRAMGLQPGMRMAVRQHGKAIELVPVPTLDELKAELKGCGSAIADEPERF
ncbi:AbrB/MazE/SpoVT family DNA-binding domain-containing protein [Comamonadaceae bacterium G21597-S1]|nr:AbrB/MazE/SpoVT family DNA-binding domain-containing protein [Comamonadaceae bacterium G21597-S1]